MGALSRLNVLEQFSDASSATPTARFRDSLQQPHPRRDLGYECKSTRIRGYCFTRHWPNGRAGTHEHDRACSASALKNPRRPPNSILVGRRCVQRSHLPAAFGKLRVTHPISARSSKSNRKNTPHMTHFQQALGEVTHGLPSFNLCCFRPGVPHAVVTRDGRLKSSGSSDFAARGAVVYQTPL